MPQGKNGGKRPGSFSSKSHALRLGAKPKNKTSKHRPEFDFSDQPKHHGPRTQEAAQVRLHQRLGEFVIDRISHDGRGITQWQGKTLFVDGALPGEKVTARFVSERGNLAEAVVDQVLTVAPERRSPPCPHHALCGGCQLQHIAPATQLELKQTAVLEQLQRWAGLAPAEILPPIVSPALAYRSCARMGVWYEKDGGVTLGFRQRHSKTLTPISQCLVLPEKLNQLLAPLREWLTVAHTAKAITHVELLESAKTCAMILRHTKVPGERDLQGLRELAQQFQCAIWLDEGKGSLRDLSGQLCDPRLSYPVPEAGLELKYHPRDFIQVNPVVNTQMIAQSIRLLDLNSSERVLDLFCGIGNFTLPLARHCAEVIGVEAVESMVERGRENAAREGLVNARFIAADLSKISGYQLQQQCGEIDAVLLDPPRDGAKEIAPHILQLKPKRILYISCNPATLARDAKILVDGGYRLQTLGVMDMFPHTRHIETMGLFVRGK